MGAQKENKQQPHPSPSLATTPPQLPPPVLTRASERRGRAATRDAPSTSLASAPAGGLLCRSLFHAARCAGGWPGWRNTVSGRGRRSALGGKPNPSHPQLQLGPSGLPGPAAERGGSGESEQHRDCEPSAARARGECEAARGIVGSWVNPKERRRPKPCLCTRHSRAG